MSTLNQRLEQIITNYKVIGKLAPGQRLIFKNKKIAIRDHYMIYTPVVRFLAGESRDDVTEGLEDLLDDTNRLIDDFLHSIELQNPNASEYDRASALSVIMSLGRLKVTLPKAYDTSNRGFNAVCETYEKDSRASAKIEGIMDNLKITIRKVNIAISDMSKKFGLENKLGNMNEIEKSKADDSEKEKEKEKDKKHEKHEKEKDIKKDESEKDIKKNVSDDNNHQSFNLPGMADDS